jgi:hypothetical protein
VARHFLSCAICGAPGHSAKNCGLAALELRKDPFGEARRIQEARDRIRAGNRRVLSGEPASLISGARRA